VEVRTTTFLTNISWVAGVVGGMSVLCVRGGLPMSLHRWSMAYMHEVHTSIAKTYDRTASSKYAFDIPEL
jgi:hypothetical protein